MLSRKHIQLASAQEASTSTPTTLVTPPSHLANQIVPPPFNAVDSSTVTHSTPAQHPLTDPITLSQSESTTGNSSKSLAIPYSIFPYPALQSPLATA